MSPALALAAVGLGVACLLAGMVWLLGPWGLLGSGVALVALGLLLPVKERRGEPPVEPAASPYD